MLLELLLLQKVGVLACDIHVLDVTSGDSLLVQVLSTVHVNLRLLLLDIDWLCCVLNLNGLSLELLRSGNVNEIGLTRSIGVESLVNVALLLLLFAQLDSLIQVDIVSDISSLSSSSFILLRSSAAFLQSSL